MTEALVAVWRHPHLFWLLSLFGLCAWAAEEVHTVPYVPSASSEGHVGVVRIESRSADAGEVRIAAVDDAGRRTEAGAVALGPRAAVEFDMEALESGDAALGLAGTGPGEGDWRLELTTELDIEARAYARSDGFLTALHDAVLVSAEEVELPLFHPGGDAPRSILRLSNAGGESATVSVRGIDDAGGSGGPVTVELGAWESRGYGAAELESGSAAGLSGSLGDGEGKWRLVLSADGGTAWATNLLLDGSGILWSVPGGMSRGAGGVHRVALFPSASDGLGRLGLVRVVNRGPEAAEVSVDAFDATERRYETLGLSLGAASSSEFGSMDLEQGNEDKGLSGSTGAGEGDWWLELSSGSDIEVLSYLGAGGGLLSPVRGAAGAETSSGMRYEALLLGDSGQLRLLNAGGEPTTVRVTGTDDAGAPGGAVRLALSPWAARTLAAPAFEAGGSPGLTGALGTGTGSWRLVLESDVEIDLLSLVSGPDGKLSDVSRRGRPTGAPARAEVVDATAALRPDLWVSASASESEVSPGESFELSATVGNRGARGSPATTLRYYRSADAAITTSDTELGTDAVAALAASAARVESLTLSAPSTAGTYYYGACADAVADESDTANNCSVAIEVAVRVPAPDLVVSAPTLRSDPSVTPPTFTLSATVTNRGNDGAAATTMRYYQSTDPTISSSDAEVGTDTVGPLGVAASSGESINLPVPAAAGTYYYGACADAVANESDTSNNCSDAVGLTVGRQVPVPDLVVGAVSASENAPAAGATFTLSATVTNSGRGAAPATTLRYFRSGDATITASDAVQGTAAVAALEASNGSEVSIEVTAPSATGVYYYGACVDAVADESSTANNCSTSVKVTVGAAPAPDLVVSGASASENMPVTGATFTLSAMVTNSGGADAPATTLRYYRSADATIETSDTPQGTDAVDMLAASGASAESIEVIAPSTAGVYYYGACADAVAGESDTANNCSAAVEVTVQLPPVPDLVVGTPTVSDGAPVAGATFILSATVTNRGGADAPATTLRYYRSTDATIETSDTAQGADAVNGLAASGGSAESIEVTAPSATGVYYYGACVDAVADESSTANNCSTSVKVTVGAAPAPDLVVSGASASENMLVTDATFTFSATVTNRGSAAADATTLRYYRSADATIEISDTAAGTDSVAALDASGSSDEDIEVTAPSTAGTYYYGACVDAVADESDAANNCSASVEVTVAAPPAPDLVVGAPTVSEDAPATGATFTLSATVTNSGDAAAAATTLRYYRSADATIETSDTAAGTDSVVALDASGSSDEDIEVTAPSAAGTYYYGACVDAVADESDAANNCSASVEVTVAAPPPAPDLVVGAPTVSEDAPTTGATFTLSATVTNSGDAAAAATTLRYYRSADATIETSDTAAGTDSVAALDASGSSDEDIEVTAPSAAGTYYYGACVDAVADESDTANNCSASVEVTVTTTAVLPDLAMVFPISIAGDDLENLATGGAFTLTVSVQNVGGVDSDAVTLRYYRSTDTTLTDADTLEGSDTVDALAPLATSTHSIELTAPSAGSYYYGGCVDAATGETDTTNNCLSLAVGVKAPPPAPDLVVGAPTVSSDTSVTTTTFTLSAMVTNSGDGAAAATTLRYYRSADATMTTSDTAAGTDPVDALDASDSSDEEIEVTAPAGTGIYYYGACVDAVLDESDTTNNCSPSVKVTVGAPKYGASAIGAFNTPDLGCHFSWGLVFDEDSEATAKNRARTACTSAAHPDDPSPDCFDHSFRYCAAIATGESTSQPYCRITSAGESTKEAAETKAVNICNRSEHDCQVVASGCNSTSL